MGQTLSQPVTTKHSETGQNDRFFFAISEMQGWRITMEDAHAAILDLDEGKPDSNTFFAVYDGHGGGTVARFAGQHVHKRLISEESYAEKNYELAMKRAFLGTDEDLLADPAHTRDPSGCTAVAALVTSDNKIYVANAGDSRSVIGIKGEVKPLSFDHKPTGIVEKARITAAGGYIEYGRVNGNLALSRALGDFEFKKNYQLSPEAQIITSNPDVTCHEISEEDEFLVLACDGIWDCLTSQQVVDFVRYQVSEGKDLTEITEAICEHCLAPDTSSGAGIGCDNMTVLIVAITHGRTKEEWYAWVTDRVKTNYGYQTPTSPPQLYAQSRLMAFRARRELEASRTRSQDEPAEDTSPLGFLSGSGLSGIARVISTTGQAISFEPGGYISTDKTGNLMFGGTDESDDESDDDSSRSFFSETLGLGRDPTKNSKEELGKYEKGISSDDLDQLDQDGDSEMGFLDLLEKPNAATNKAGSSSELQGEAPPPVTPLPNGDSQTIKPVEQLHSTPGGDAPSPAVKLEGLSDKSEDPLKN